MGLRSLATGIQGAGFSHALRLVINDDAQGGALAFEAELHGTLNPPNSATSSQRGK